jgi:hypothetical protein
VTTAGDAVKAESAARLARRSSNQPPQLYCGARGLTKLIIPNRPARSTAASVEDYALRRLDALTTRLAQGCGRDR